MSFLDKLRRSRPKIHEEYLIGYCNPDRVSNEEIKDALSGIKGIQVEIGDGYWRAVVVRPGRRDVDDVLDAVAAKAKRIGVPAIR